MSELLGGWKDLTSQFTSILITVVLVCIICIIYNVKVKGQDPKKETSGFVILINMIITSIEDLVVSILGKKYRMITPYFLYIFLYIIVGSFVSLFGFESPTSSLTITFSMALVTFVMIYYFGIKYQKATYLKRYINPLELFTQFTPLLSMSFRLFGNLLGGSIILGLVYGLFIGIQTSWAPNHNVVYDGVAHWPTFGMWNTFVDGVDVNGDFWKLQYQYWWSGINIFTTVFAPFLHFYFDIFDSVIQSVVFMMLSLSYWAEAMGEEQGLEVKEPKKYKKNVIFKVLETKKSKQNKQI